MDELLPSRVKMEMMAAASNSHHQHDDDANCIMSNFDTDSDMSTALMQNIQAQNDELQGVFPEVAEDHELNNHSIHEIEESEDITLIQLMDIRTRLSKLMSMLEKRAGINLTDYEFWLQNSKMLESHKTLVDQCIRGEGIVQVNIQIKPVLKRINIVDVLKPDEEYIDVDEIPSYCDDALLDDDISTNSTIQIENPLALELLSRSQGAGSQDSFSEEKKVSMMVKWIVDMKFKADQTRLNIPQDPKLWSVPQVKFWIQWAVRQFHLNGIKLTDWSFPGSHLCNLTLEEFKSKCPSDPLDLFWTHIEVLRSCKFIAIVQNEDEIKEALNLLDSNKAPSPTVIKKKSTKQSSPVSVDSMVRSNNNGQIQLWQFLLELLTSTEHTDVIQWIGTNGEFKLQDPEFVAKLWGQRKHKPTMNYEKLSRALRYYYDGDMIAKVHNKRFVYRFVCDLKQLIGYDASDLARLVNGGSGNDKNPKDSNQVQLFW